MPFRIAAMQALSYRHVDFQFELQHPPGDCPRSSEIASPHRLFIRMNSIKVNKINRLIVLPSWHAFCISMCIASLVGETEMKKIAQLRSFLRQIIERFATVLLGIICLVLVLHYWSDAGSRQAKSAVPMKMLIVMENEKLIIMKKTPKARFSIMQKLGFVST
jgi:hypothetical protein